MSNQLDLLNPGGSAMRKVSLPLRVIGIDLGTTNSTVAEIVWNSEPQAEIDIQCIEVDQETASGLYTHLLVPSAVALYQGKEWIGEGAKRLHARAPEFGLESLKNLFFECKNDIGSKRTYHKAPEGYRSAAEVGGKVLGFLKKASDEHNPLEISRTVVTVPASFQAAQRIDTIRAAELADIEVCGGDLLDEPVAAFLDYLLQNTKSLKGVLSKPKNLLVFDFGGGTCDVAIFNVGKAKQGTALQISSLAVSRYHRLGGADIDRAILHEALLPQLLQQNNLDSFALTFEDKKNILEPSFLGVAESLKIGLCNEIARLKSFNQYVDADKDKILKKQPGLHSCKIGERILELNSPTLSAHVFDDLLAPFLDTDLLYARETEYRLTCSIFAPIQDALDRSSLKTSDIDLCLLVGGCSLIPQVVEALGKFFDAAQILTFSDRDAVQVATARGAAAHSLALALYGRSIFQLSSHDRISIRTAHGSYELLPKGASLPFPTVKKWQKTLDLTVPETSILEPVPLLVEILAGDAGEERSLMMARWDISAPVNKGDRLCLEYRLDENQVLEFRLSLDNSDQSSPFTGRIENPLSNVVNPNAIRMKIQQSEEELRTGQIEKANVPDKVVEIGRDYAELGQHEKAISYLKQALRQKNRPDPYVLNLLGIYHGERGDYKSQEKYYREAHAAGGGDNALFNLALAQYRQKLYKEAAKTIEERQKIVSDGPGLTLAAQIDDNLKNDVARDSNLKKALKEFGAVRSVNEWELGWFVTAARMAGDAKRTEEALAEQKRRKKNITAGVETVTGVLPEMAGTLRKV